MEKTKNLTSCLQLVIFSFAITNCNIRKVVSYQPTEKISIGLRSINTIVGCPDGVLTGGNDGIVMCTDFELTKSRVIRKFEDTQIESILELPGNEYLIVTFDKGLFLMTEDGKIKKSLFNDEKTIDAFYYSNDDSNLYVGSENSLFAINLKSYSIQLLYDNFQRGTVLSINKVSDTVIAVGCFQSTVFLFDTNSKGIIREIYIKEGFAVEAMHKINNLLIVGGTPMSYSDSVIASIDLRTYDVSRLDYCQLALKKIMSDFENVYLVCGNVIVLNQDLSMHKLTLDVPSMSASSLWIHGQYIFLNGGSSHSNIGGWLYRYSLKI